MLLMACFIEINETFLKMNAFPIRLPGHHNSRTTYCQAHSRTCTQQLLPLSSEVRQHGSLALASCNFWKVGVGVSLACARTFSYVKGQWMQSRRFKIKTNTCTGVNGMFPDQLFWHFSVFFIRYWKCKALLRLKERYLLKRELHQEANEKKGCDKKQGYSLLFFTVRKIVHHDTNPALRYICVSKVKWFTCNYSALNGYPGRDTLWRSVFAQTQPWKISELGWVSCPTHKWGKPLTGCMQTEDKKNGQSLSSFEDCPLCSSCDIWREVLQPAEGTGSQLRGLHRWPRKDDSDKNSKWTYWLIK